MHIWNLIIWETSFQMSHLSLNINMFLSIIYKRGALFMKSYGETVSRRCVFWVILKIGLKTTIASISQYDCAILSVTSDFFKWVRLTTQLDSSRRNYQRHCIAVVMERFVGCCQNALEHTPNAILIGNSFCVCDAYGDMELGEYCPW